MIRQAKTIILMGLLTWLFGCKDNKGTAQTQIINHDNVQLEDMTSRFDAEEGWNDIFLRITSVRKTDSTHIYISKGLYKDKVVGLQVEISSKIGAGIVGGEIDNKNGFVANGVKLKSIGKESDELVRALAELYKYPTTKEFSKQPITATVFSLNQKPADFNKKDYYKFKLFFEENDEHLYSEIFLNINTDKAEIEIHEKDEEYREPIIKVWTK